MTSRRRQLLERDLRAALDVPEAAGPGVVEWLRGELERCGLPSAREGEVKPIVAESTLGTVVPRARWDLPPWKYRRSIGAVEMTGNVTTTDRLGIGDEVTFPAIDDDEGPVRMVVTGWRSEWPHAVRTYRCRVSP